MKTKAAELVMESPDGKNRTEVNNNESIGIMEGLGWKVVGEVKPSKKVEKLVPEGSGETVTGTGAGKQLPLVDGKEKTDGPATPDYSGMKKADLQKLLDAKKIPYDDHATKADLIELLGTK